MSDEVKELENLTMRHDIESMPGCIHCEALNLARRLLEERNEAINERTCDSHKETHSDEALLISIFGTKCPLCQVERIASLERQIASYEGMDRAVDHYQEEVRRLERELEEAMGNALEDAAKYLESTFGRCNLLAANGYLNGDDVAEKIRALESKQ